MLQSSSDSKSSTTPAAILEERLKAAVIEAYRGELRQRYSETNVRRFAELHAISAETITALREFFLRYIYPPHESRGARDSSFDEMGRVLKSPRKLLPLFGTALTSIWKLGGRIGQAIQAGLRTLEAYIESKRLENAMIEIALNEDVAPEKFSERETVSRIVRGISPKKVRRFQKDMLLLFESLANVKLLENSLEIMRDSREVMVSRPEVYTPTELSGLDFGLELLGAGYELFRALSAPEVAAVLAGIELIEADWYQTVFES